MKLQLAGHNYKYAVEQIMLALFPEERPEYPAEKNDDPADCNITGEQDVLFAESKLIYSTTYAQATTRVHRNGITSRGTARVRRDKLTGKLISDRLLQRIIKQSFFRAASRFLEATPVWGSLTGIRPSQIAAKILESGVSENSTAKKLVCDYYVSPERADLCVKTARSALSLRDTINRHDVAIYIGIPFCPTRCAYCSFVSNSVGKSFGLIEPFANMLLQEIDETAGIIRKLGLNVIAVYIGGGTPTALPEEALERIMSVIDVSFDKSNLREYTVEAGRPDTFTTQKLDIMTRFGVSRICINPQSMSNEVLAAIGRRHTSDDIIKSVKLVRQTKSSLNMDVITGLPGDTCEGFRNTLDTILDIKPENITVHTLALKKGSRIMLEDTVIPGADQVSAMLDYASGRLSESGYDPYYLYRQKYISGGFENTGWSLPGYDCIYNICMMEELCTVISLGGGGVTKLVSGDGRIERIFNAKYPREYIMQKPPDGRFLTHMEYKTSKIKDFL